MTKYLLKAIMMIALCNILLCCYNSFSWCDVRIQYNCGITAIKASFRMIELPSYTTHYINMHSGGLFGFVFLHFMPVKNYFSLCMF